ncbi:Panacea domain-containing protein [Oceanobacter mangrovi]|uniref:Panacea domain-containing protein n=1 Tax=Oceanobacter mangrovi TaxID=2862510 RepID=UPI001C8DC3B2|nr:type II toxin-antitoxin system antitoxin SocA domain-containing protein [Oceanobacter mangrovi]
MVRAVDVSYKLLQLASERGLQLSNLQLQKLLYIAHGYLLAWKNKPMFDDDISAWKYGPVIHGVYEQFREYGASKIPVGEIESGIDDAEVLQALEGTLNLYGDRDAMDLVNLTHQPNTPWYQIYEVQDGKRDQFARIPNDMIKDHYRKVISSPDSVAGL